jgi:hypothetical protein
MRQPGEETSAGSADCAGWARIKGEFKKSKLIFEFHWILEFGKTLRKFTRRLKGIWT